MLKKIYISSSQLSQCKFNLHVRIVLLLEGSSVSLLHLGLASKSEQSWDNITDDRGGPSGQATAMRPCAVGEACLGLELGTGNRREPLLLLSLRGQIPALSGTTAAAHYLGNSASRGPMKLTCPHRIRSTWVHYPASPSSQYPSDFEAQLRLSPGAVTTQPAVCALGEVLTHHSPVSLALSRHWLVVKERGRAMGALRAAPRGPTGAPWHQQPGSCGHYGW